MKAFAITSIILALFVSGVKAQNLTVYDDALQNGWQNYGWATLNYTNTSPVHSGSDSISVVDPGSTAQALYLHHAALNSSLYQSLTFWIYSKTAKTNEVQVQATVNGNAQTAVALSFTSGQVNQWQQVTIPLSSLGVASTTSFDGFWIQNISGGPLTFYVDDISLVAATVPNPVPLAVDAQSIVRTIDSRFYGLNLAVWDSNLNSAATGSVLATMQTGAVRLPGGSSSDDYDWSTGRDISNSSFQWANSAVTFAGVAAAAAAQAYVTVNYGSGTPEQAAAWVAYYNGSTTNTSALGTDSKGRDWKTVGYWATMRGAAHLATDDGYNFLRASHPAPYAFRYWEIGNECYGDWEYDLHGTSGSGLTGVAHDPYTYAQNFRSYFTKMLAVDPTIHIGAVATTGEDSYGNGAHSVPNPNESNSLHSGWAAVLLANLRSLGVTPHFLIHHSYAQNPGSENDAVLLQASSSLATDAANLRKMITDYVGGTPGNTIELVVTELNSVSSNPGKQATSLVNALFYGDAIGQLAKTEFNAALWWDLRNGVTYGNSDASLYGWRPFGDYGVVASGDVAGTPVNTPFPSFYAGKLLAQWGRGGDRVVSATSGYALLSIYAAKLVNGSLALLVINKHPSSDLPAQIALSHFTPGATSVPVFSYGKQNDLANADLTAGTASVSGATISYTFPSYSMTLLVVKGQFEVWREQNFTAGELSNWALSGDNGQPAQDGIPNLVKYALGLNAKVSSSAGLPGLGTTVIGGKKYFTLSFTDLSSLSDITYNVQVSSDLQSWQSGPGYTLRIDGGTTNTATYRDLTAIQDAPRRFMRLSITRP